MRYLKRIFESEITDESIVVEDIKDIILDIKDLDNFEVYVTTNDRIIELAILPIRDRASRSSIVKELFKNENEKQLVIEVLERIRDYGKSNGYIVDLTWLGRLKNMTEKELNNALSINRQTYGRETMFITMYPKNL